MADNVKNARKCSKGNTNTFEQKFRNFVFTLFKDDPPKFNDDIRYLAYGSEICPTTGRHHFQSFVVMKNQKTFTAMKKYLRKWVNVDCWFEPMHGSLKDNEVYCSKDKKYIEFGDKPNQGARGDLEEIKDNIRNNIITVDEIIMDNPILYHQYGRTLSKIEDICLRKKFRDFMTEGIWYWGETGTGKSFKAFENFNPDTHYNVPNDNGWWDAYKQQETVIINDFRGHISYNDMLQMVDIHPYDVKRRGREPMPFLSKKVIITSSLHPEDVYHNRADEDKIEQLLRRFKIIKMVKK